MGFIKSLFRSDKAGRSDFLTAMNKLKELNYAYREDFNIALGMCHHQLQDYKNAALCYEMALRINPDSSVVMFCIAKVYKDSGFKKEIFRDPLSYTWYDAIKVLPNYSVEYANIASMFSGFSENKIAIHFFQLSRKEDPSDNRLYPLLANEYARLGDLSNSLKYLKIAIELNPHDTSLIEARTKVEDKIKSKTN